MSCVVGKVFAPHPVPKRAQGFFFGYNAAANRILYPLDNLIYIRGLTDINDVSIYGEHAAKTTIASWSPSGRWIASCDELGKIRVWTPQNADRTLAIETAVITGPIWDVAWTGDSERLAVVGQGSRGYGGCINATTGASLGEVGGHTAAVQSVALKPQRPFKMVTCGDDFASVFYNGPPFRVAKIISDHTKFVFCVRYAPDGSVFATSSLDGKIFIYDGTEGEKKATFEFGTGMPAITFSPDSKSILAGTLDGRVLQIAVANGAIQKEWKIGAEVFQQQNGVLWAKEKLSISLSGDFYYLKDDGTFRIEFGHAAGITILAKTAAGWATGDTGGRALAWDGKEAVALQTPEGGAPVSGIAALGDKIVVARCDGKFTIIGDHDTKIDGGRKGVTLVSGKSFVVGYTEKRLVKWDGKAVVEQDMGFVPTALAISADATKIAIGGADKQIHIFNPALKEIALVKGDIPQSVAAIGFSPSGNQIAASSDGKEITVWSLSKPSESLHTGWRFHSGTITAILWIDEGNLLTVAKDRSIRLWSLAKKREYVEVPRAHEGQIVGAIWAAPGLLVTAGTDGAIRTWNVKAIQ